MTPNLDTTNMLLGVIATASAIEALIVIGIGVAGFIAYRRVMALVEGLESRHIQPTMARVRDVLDDVKTISATVKDETERVDHAIRHTVDRVDQTAQRVRTNVRIKTSRVVGFIRGARVALETLLETPS
jgi:hypothetical protein